MSKKKEKKNIGKKIHELAKRLWPINRSITGEGVRKSLRILKEIFPKLSIVEVKSGKKVFDWTIPQEWNVSEAWVKNSKNKKIIDFANNNLHLVGYSHPVKAEINLKKLKKHLYSLPDQPKAIPYVTSYYKKRWGFCISEKDKKKLKPGNYKVFINSKFKKGSLTYGEIIIPGRTKKEIFLSTNICHPSMANNELSGPTVTVYLAKWIRSLKKRNFTYRIVFVPETIGSITYLNKNYKKMKNNIYGGFNVVCVGDEKNYSYLPSRNGETISDVIAKHVLSWTVKKYKTYTWLQRGSDERQYCSPGIDLPIASMMRSKYGDYSEYHTSLDNLRNVVTPAGLEGGYNVIKKAIEIFEMNCFPKTTSLGEPQLSKKNLYPSLSMKNSSNSARLLMNVLSYCDGKTAVVEIAEKVNKSIWSIYPIIEILNKNKLIILKNNSSKK